MDLFHKIYKLFLILYDCYKICTHFVKAVCLFVTRC
jgi:hypothetical protein